jgi:hypothetical protein
MSNGETPRYDAARAALRECAEVDECQSLDVGKAITIYGKQADDEMIRTALEIQRRAIRERHKLARELVAVLHFWDDPASLAALGIDMSCWPQPRAELEVLLASVIAEGSA